MQSYHTPTTETWAQHIDVEGGKVCRTRITPRSHADDTDVADAMARATVKWLGEVYGWTVVENEVELNLSAWEGTGNETGLNPTLRGDVEAPILKGADTVYAKVEMRMCGFRRDGDQPIYVYYVHHVEDQ